MTVGQPSRRQFESTHWSMAMRSDVPRAVDARAALVELCLRYWYPVYAYLRCFGHGPESAQDIARSFLQHLFRHFRDGGTRRAQGRFRHYLLERLRTFMAGDERGDPDGEVIAELAESPPGLELRYQRDNANARSPEQAYQQSFALELLERATSRLREEATQTGHMDMYETLEGFLAIDPTAAECEQAARRLQVRTVVVMVALKRMRQRFRELIDSELADTVASAEELLAEQQALFAVLRDSE
jgi:RNA polymerase sigma-70 factor (ECF subfamily)